MTTWTQVGQHMQCRIQRDIMTRFHFHSKVEIVIWLIFCIFYRYRLITFNDVIGCIMIRKRETMCFMDQNWYLLMMASQGILNSKYRCTCVHLEAAWVVQDKNQVYIWWTALLFFLCVRLLRALLFPAGYCVDPWGFLFTPAIGFLCKTQVFQILFFYKKFGLS